MTTAIVLLDQGATTLTGTGTLDLGHFGDRVAGYCFVNGTDAGTFEFRDGASDGDLLFKWGSSTIAASFWPTMCRSKTLWYSVSGTGAYAVVSPVIV